MRLTTERLELVAGTAELARADISDRARFARLLGARVPPAWPPPLNDEASMEWSARIHESDPGAQGWGVWYFLLRDALSGERDALSRERGALSGERGDLSGTPVAIGNGGFKGRPTPDGTVEIGYSLLEEHQGKGYAAEAVQGLLGWAFGHREVRLVVAETLPELGRSIRLLENCGFQLVGPGSEQGAIRYELPRPRFERRRPRRVPPAQ